MTADAMTSAQRSHAANNLAARLLAGAWALETIADSVRSTLPTLRARSRAALTVEIFALGEETFPPAPTVLADLLLRSRLFRPVHKRGAAIPLDPPQFAPTVPFTGLSIPAVATLGDLASWLGMSMEHLDWFSGARGQPGDPILRHYRYALIPKRSGGVRLLEAPKLRLKTIQRHILHEILDAVPAHPSAHGFVAGRSCLTGARVHAGEAVVATFDLAQFFPFIGAPRVHGLFRCLGYPWAVARALTGLCTTVTPREVMAELPTLYRVPHLPQGAPTSPALANLLAWQLDRRLSRLAASVGGQYTRYADDLAFSGRIPAGKTLETIVREEGFALNVAKTRTMRRDARQTVTGIVVNEHVNVSREDFDRLKAILHNCAVHGPSSQNIEGRDDFRRHLEGRVVWVEQVNLARGRKLRALFDRIDWRDQSATK